MADQQFDVFLCHNSEDKPAVIEIAQQLKQNDVKPWLDLWELRPGVDWQEALEEQIKQIRCVAVFVGGSGLGPWQKPEMRAFIRASVKQGSTVIPVLLPSVPEVPDLPVFLEGFHWVDFRMAAPDPLVQLVWGITGRKQYEPMASEEMANISDAYSIQNSIEAATDEELFVFNLEKGVIGDSSCTEDENVFLEGSQKSNLFLKQSSNVNRDIPEFWLALTFGFCAILGYLVTLSNITPSAVSWAVVMIWSVIVAWDQIELGALFMAGALTAIWDRLFDYDSGAGIMLVGFVAFLWAGILAVVTAIACAVTIFVAGSKLRRTFPYEQVFLILMGSATVGLIVGTSLKLLLLSLSQTPTLPQ